MNTYTFNGETLQEQRQPYDARVISSALRDLGAKDVKLIRSHGTLKLVVDKALTAAQIEDLQNLLCQFDITKTAVIDETEAE